MKQQLPLQQPSPYAPDWGALAQKYDRHVWLRLLALRVPPEQAQDLKQEVWETLICKWNAGKLDYVQMPGLALRQAEYTVKQARRGHRLSLVDNVVELADLRAESNDVEAQLAHRARLRHVLSVVEAASQQTRRVFELSYCPPCLAAKDVASRLNLSVQRVRQILCELRVQIGRPS